MKDRRDDFSSLVKTTLAGRVAWICSFPGCNCSTAGPAQESKDKWIKNGIAAHITAAAPGGPRYDPSMTSEQRSDISNGIWMCPSHASLIDKENCNYKTEEIKHWKIEAENRAARNLELNQITNPFNAESIYSKKDRQILSDYSKTISCSTIQIIKNEPFGSIVKDIVIDPINEIIEMDENPKFKFQDFNLENLRQTLNSQAKKFISHFRQQSAGTIGGYQYIDLKEYSRKNPESRFYWECEINKTQDLAAEFCSTAMQLLEIKENN